MKLFYITFIPHNRKINKTIETQKWRLSCGEEIELYLPRAARAQKVISPKDDTRSLSFALHRRRARRRSPPPTMTRKRKPKKNRYPGSSPTGSATRSGSSAAPVSPSTHLNSTVDDDASTPPQLKKLSNLVLPLTQLAHLRHRFRALRHQSSIQPKSLTRKLQLQLKLYLKIKILRLPPLTTLLESTFTHLFSRMLRFHQPHRLNKQPHLSQEWKLKRLCGKKK